MKLINLFSVFGPAPFTNSEVQAERLRDRAEQQQRKAEEIAERIDALDATVRAHQAIAEAMG